MKRYEIDWRKSSVRQILSALSQGLDVVRELLSDDGDVDTAAEYWDDLCGIAFVTAQAYITGVVADAKALRGKELSKEQLLKSANPIVADTTLTQMQLCDTMANYYKHRDEWADWDNVEGPAARTIDRLRAAGFAESHEYLCANVAQLIFGNMKVGSLAPLADMLASWREALLAE